MRSGSFLDGQSTGAYFYELTNEDLDDLSGNIFYVGKHSFNVNSPTMDDYYLFNYEYTHMAGSGVGIITQLALSRTLANLAVRYSKDGEWSDWSYFATISTVDSKINSAIGNTIGRSY